MDIHFRTRKYGTSIDASYFVMEGPEMASLDHWHIGDTVSVMLPATEEQSEALQDYGKEGLRIYDGKAHVPCVVVKRSHTVVWEKVGTFQVLIRTGITLEVDDGEWEDVLVWIATGKRPEWAPAGDK